MCLPGFTSDAALRAETTSEGFTIVWKKSWVRGNSPPAWFHTPALPLPVVYQAFNISVPQFPYLYDGAGVGGLRAPVSQGCWEDSDLTESTSRTLQGAWGTEKALDER